MSSYYLNPNNYLPLEHALLLAELPKYLTPKECAALFQMSTKVAAQSSRFRWLRDIVPLDFVATCSGKAFIQQGNEIKTTHIIRAGKKCSAAALYNHTLVIASGEEGYHLEVHKRKAPPLTITMVPPSQTASQNSFQCTPYSTSACVGINRHHFVRFDKSNFCVWETLSWEESRFRFQSAIQENLQGESLLALDVLHPLAVTTTTASHGISIWRWDTNKLGCYPFKNIGTRLPKALALDNEFLAIMGANGTAIRDLNGSSEDPTMMLNCSPSFPFMKWQEHTLYTANTNTFGPEYIVWDVRDKKKSTKGALGNKDKIVEYLDLQGQVLAAAFPNYKEYNVDFFDARNPGKRFAIISIPRSPLTLFQLCGDSLYTVNIRGVATSYNFLKLLK